MEVASPPALFSYADDYFMLILIVAGVSLLRERPEGFAVALWTASPALLSQLIVSVAFLVSVLFVHQAMA